MNKQYVKKVLVDPDTGERIETLAIVREVTNKNFSKIFVLELLSRLSETDKTDFPVRNMLRIFKFISQLLEMMDPNTNIIYASISELARTMMVTRDTARRYIKSLQTLGLMENVGYGKWQLDPSVFSQVNAEQHKNIMVQYKAVKAKREYDKNQRILFKEEVGPGLLEAVNA